MVLKMSLHVMQTLIELTENMGGYFGKSSRPGDF